MQRKDIPEDNNRHKVLQIFQKLDIPISPVDFIIHSHFEPEKK